SAVITGGASGLGRATATRLAAEGWAVVIADLPGSGGGEVADALGDAVRFVEVDVTDPDQPALAVEAAGSLAPLRLAVCCAGIAPAAKLLGRDEPHDAGLFARTLAVNLTGTFHTVRAAAEAIAATEPEGGERGVIVMTASIAAVEGQIGQVAYSASKGGVQAMTLPLARELARSGVRVMTISPGVFQTPLSSAMPEAVRDSLGGQVPFPPRLGRADEYADLVATIVRTPYLNAEVIRLDGGIRMAPR
ncbi:SDR family NAD(P)-dependent oxidoreductase, partial [Mycetocola reblochoni]